MRRVSHGGKVRHRMLENSYRDKADFFFNACVTDLRQFSTRTLARPVALLLAYAYMHAYYQIHEYEIAPKAKIVDFGQPIAFKCQFAELYWARDLFRHVVRAIKNAVGS